MIIKIIDNIKIFVAKSKYKRLNKSFLSFSEKIAHLCLENEISLYSEWCEDGSHRFIFPEIMINGKELVYRIDKKMAESKDPKVQKSIEEFLDSQFEVISDLVKNWKNKDSQ